MNIDPLTVYTAAMILACLLLRRAEPELLPGLLLLLVGLLGFLVILSR